jgi:hypothetical protein
VLPYMSRGAGHHVERARFGIEREAIPVLAGGSAEPKLAGGSERKTEYPVEVGLVAVPADADADAILRAKNLLNQDTRAAERFDLFDDLSSQAGIGSDPCNCPSA